jgi:hypothetical protein
MEISGKDIMIGIYAGAFAFTAGLLLVANAYGDCMVPMTINNTTLINQLLAQIITGAV